MARVLFVDDEPNILEGIKRGLRARVELHTATSGAQGLTVLSEAGPFDVVVSDMRMPEMTGVQFLAKVRDCSPQSVRMILSGQADLEATISAVNEGQIFRFVNKPCPSDQLWKVLQAGIEQYRLITAEKELLEQTLAGATKLLIEVLAIVSPAAHGRASRLQRYVVDMSTAIGLPDRWQLPLAAMLSQIGCVTLPKDTLSKLDARQALSDDEKRLYDCHPEIAGKLLAAIPRLEEVAAIVAGQRQLPELYSWPADLRQCDTLSLGRALLRAASEFDRRVGDGMSPAAAVEELRAAKHRLPPTVIDALSRLKVPGYQATTRLIGLKELVPGMVIDQDLMSTRGARLVVRGQEVTSSLLVRLQTIAGGVGVVEPIRVQVFV